MPDHGLFSASIVRQLAPHAEIHLVRVLSDYGVGDLLALTDVLGRLPAALNPRGDRRLVVNLSLVAGMPPSGEMLSLWFPHSVHDAPTVRSWHVDMARTLDFAHRSLAETISWLTAQGVLVVAAAGNDAGDAGVGTAPLPPEPRIPARYEDVLAVAAVKRSSFDPAPFSNRGDVAIMGNGVAVFGGDARPAEGGDADDPWVTVDGVVGAFSSPALPLGGGPNQHRLGGLGRHLLRHPHHHRPRRRDPLARAGAAPGPGDRAGAGVRPPQRRPPRPRRPPGLPHHPGHPGPRRGAHPERGAHRGAPAPVSEG